MQEIITIPLIAIALSMDTFSFSLSLGTANIDIKKGFILSFLIGLMHFIMPLLGTKIGKIVLKILPLEHNFFLGVIFLVLAFKMIYDLYIEQEDKISLNVLGMFIISISVSFDAFTTGIGLQALTGNIYNASMIFMIISFIFTMLGIIIGKYINEKIGRLSSIFGIIILLIMAMYLII
ncbi:MAG: hypothetical protein E7158_02175 [Firmicutes bacterium]|nr:hypothetical protein [Bacillota bacterium]